MSELIKNSEEIGRRIADLGDWFHNMNLGGVQTAPNHFLGDYPSCKWKHLQSGIPADLSGKTVLDIGCNGGFYCVEMKRRNAARVVGIDTDRRYLDQARLAASILGLEIELYELDIYDVASLGEKFDLVLFMGVFYHLRHPLLALDLLFKHSVRETLIFQSLMRGCPRVGSFEPDYSFDDVEVFKREDFPRMYFIEHRYADDPSNWWIPNRTCVEAMLRSAGFQIVGNPEDEAYICVPRLNG